MRYTSPVVYLGNHIGKNVVFGEYVLIRQDNEIGSNVRIGSYTEIAHNVIVEDDVQIHSHCFIAEGTIIGENTWIGPHTILINDNYPQTNGKYRKSVKIGKNVIIGASCTIMPGIEIGENAFIGAGSVVTKNVPNGEVWYGSPAKYIKVKDKLDAYK